MSGRRIPVVSPDGSVGTVPEEQANDAFDQGYKAATDEQYAQLKADEKHREEAKRMDSPMQAMVAENLGAASGVASTFGIPLEAGITQAAGLIGGDDAETKARDYLRKIDEHKKGWKTYGEIGGTLAPAVLGDEMGVASLGARAEGAASAALGGGKIAKAAGWGARAATEGAALGAVSSINEQAVRDGVVSPQKVLADAAVGMGIGAIGGVALGAASPYLADTAQALSGAFRRGEGKIAKVLETASEKRLIAELGVSGGTLRRVIDDAGADAPRLYASIIQDEARRQGIDMSRVSAEQAVEMSQALADKAQEALGAFDNSAVEQTSHGKAILDLKAKLEKIPNVASTASELSDRVSTLVELGEKFKAASAELKDIPGYKDALEMLAQRKAALELWSEGTINRYAKILQGGSGLPFFDSAGAAAYMAGHAVAGPVGGVAGRAGSRLATGYMKKEFPYAGSAYMNKVSTWAKLQAASDSMDRKIAKGVEAFFRGARTVAARTPVIFTGSGEERDAKVTKHLDAMAELVANPTSMAAHTERATNHLVDSAHEIVPALSGQIARNVNSVLAKAPKNQMPPSVFGPKRARYADADVHDYEIRLATTAHPMEAIEALREGRLTKAHVDALRESAPDVLEALQKEVIKAAQDAKHHPSVEKLNTLYLLLGQPLTPEQQPEVLGAIQAGYEADRNKRQEGSQGGGSQAKPGSISKRMESPSERLEEPK